MKTETIYLSPYVKIFEILPEGVLCSSNGNEGVGEEGGAGEFN